jgi:hypothetical protein
MPAAAAIRIPAASFSSRRTDRHSGNRDTLAPWKLVRRALLL